MLLEFHFDQKWTFYIWILNFHTEVNCEVSIDYSTVNVRNTRSCQFYRHNFSHSWMVLWLISSNFLHAARLLLFFSLVICKMIIGASSGTSWETININEWRASSSRVHVTPSFFFVQNAKRSQRQHFQTSWMMTSLSITVVLNLFGKLPFLKS